ncbi:MAG: guanylate kinase [Candidatus Eremiobacteraeota bacterium]|nr:guanylate kinase [Candidatus Eremiobacteraeota bacterium]MBV9407819.1 guanylate kinase [Candidatus Eremiobacteraeota bacterium]
MFVVSGPSGAGKDTLVDGLRARHERLLYSVSATTREPRPGEREGTDYFFLTRDEFERRLATGGFLEHREYNGNRYGTPRSFIDQALRDGYDVVSKPEVNGALAIKSKFPDAVLIFIVPDKFSHLRSRLEARRTETNEQIAARLEIAHDEFTFVRRFDYLVINEEAQPQRAVDDLEAIVRSERYRIHRYPDTRLKELEDS